MMTRGFVLRLCVLLAGLLVAGPAGAQGTVEPGPWREFQGIWTATGQRHSIPLGADRRAAIASHSGTLLLSGPSRPAVGFRAESVVLTDTQSGMTGRAVWTDDNGDMVFSELSAASIAPGSLISATIIGGTGRYAGATGDYSFTWRFQIAGEDGLVQGQSLGLKGRVRITGGMAGVAR